jgi:NADH-quinone oxidoreductase subunit E
MEVNEKMKELASRYPREKRFSLAMLQDVQREFNYVPKEALGAVSEHLGVPLSRLYGMATFYKALSLRPKGRYAIKVCDGTACHIRSSLSVIEELEKVLGIGLGGVTEDGMFSIETVNCVGACALAPVMLINGEYHGKLKAGDVAGIIEGYRGGGGNG